MAEIFSSTVVDVLFDASMYSDRIWFLSSLSYDRFNVRLFSQELVLRRYAPCDCAGGVGTVCTGML